MRVETLRMLSLISAMALAVHLKNPHIPDQRDIAHHSTPDAQCNVLKSCFQSFTFHRTKDWLYSTPPPRNSSMDFYPKFGQNVVIPFTAQLRCFTLCRPLIWSYCCAYLMGTQLRLQSSTYFPWSKPHCNEWDLLVSRHVKDCTDSL